MTSDRKPAPLSRPGRWMGYAAAGWAFASAAVSLYWGVGGTFGLETVGAQAVELSESGALWAFALLWFVAAVKATGGLLALALVRPWGPRLLRHWMLLLAGWGGTLVLLGYGAANLALELIVKTGALQVPADFDWTGFHGHLYLWTPHFLLWGLLLGFTALAFTLGTRRRKSGPSTEE